MRTGAWRESSGPVAEMNPLRLLNYLNQALTVRHQIVTQLEPQKMPPPSGIADAVPAESAAPPRAASPTSANLSFISFLVQCAYETDVQTVRCGDNMRRLGCVVALEGVQHERNTLQLPRRKN